MTLLLPGDLGFLICRWFRPLGDELGFFALGMGLFKSLW